MDFYTALSITLISMAFSAFFSGMEIAFISSNRVRVELDSKKGGIVNHMINFFYRHKDMFISTMLVGNNIMLVIYGMGMAVLLTPLIVLISDNQAFVLLAQTLISTCIILITGEFVPKTVFRINPNSSLRHFSFLLYAVYMILYPISWLASFLSKIIMRLFGAKTATAESSMLTVGELDDYIQKAIDEKKSTDDDEIEHEVKIFQNALDFSTTYLRDCMIPRTDIVGIDIEDTSTEELREKFITTGLSKIIVYKNDIDNIIGYIHISEMFDSGKDWKNHIPGHDTIPVPASFQDFYTDKDIREFTGDVWYETDAFIPETMKGNRCFLRFVPPIHKPLRVQRSFDKKIEYRVFLPVLFIFRLLLRSCFFILVFQQGVRIQKPFQIS